MTAPALIRRSLTVNFARAITAIDQVPEVMEVVVIPLSDPSSPSGDVTLVGGLQKQSIVLSQETNSIVFQLVPTDEPGLTQRVTYRIAWRKGVTGRTYTYDFAMPDRDLDFDDLFDLGEVIGGEVYLQQTDLGVAGRVARLNNLGQVVDAEGVPVAGQADVSAVQGALNVEIVNRQQAVAALRTTLTSEFTTQVNTTLNNAKQYTDTAAAVGTSARQAETNARIAGDNTLSGQISSLTTSLDSLTSTVESHDSVLPTKADLDESGHIPIGQIPSAAITNWVSVADQSAMLALTYPAQIQPGDIVILASGIIYGLTNTTPSELGSWIRLNKVTSVNGYDGDVTLTAADVGAVATEDGSVSIDQVTGLSTALDGKASTGVTDGLDTRITSIENDTTIVHTVGGVIDHDLNDDHMAYVNPLTNEVIKKDGTILTATGAVESVNGHTGIINLTAADVGAIATGGSIDTSQVTGLATLLSGKVDSDDSRLTDARTPTSHAASHASVGSDPVTVAQSQVTGLSAIISNNGFTNLSNHENRIQALESFSLNEIQSLTVDASAGTYTLEFDSQTTGNIGFDANEAAIQSALEGLSTVGTGGVAVTFDTDHFHIEFTGPLSVTDVPTIVADDTNLTGTATVAVIQNGGSGGGGATKATWWNGTENFTAVTDPEDFQTVHSVQLRGPFAKDTGGDFAYYQSGVAGPGDVYVWPYITPNGHLELREWNETNPPDPAYALDSDLSSLSTAVSFKASQEDLNTLSGTVANKADESEVSALTSTVASKADQSALDIVSNTVNTKASQSSLDTLTTTVSGKASQSDLTVTQSAVSSIQTTLTIKADLDGGGKVPLAQIPTLSGASKLSDWGTKADLSGGKVPLNQIPTGIPTANVSGLDATLAAKADLVAGKLATSQLPTISTHETYAVANRAAMLALTTAQVQVGDSCIVTATGDQGTYTLIASDPSQFSNWLLNEAPASPVSSVNGQIGTVVLSWTDVGALAANAAIPISQVTNLQTTINGLATTTALSTGLATKTSTSDVQSMLSASTEIKQKANYVATSSVASLSGQQTADGVLMSLGSVVLLTAQSSSVTNGLWTVNSGAWTRPTDFSTGSWLVKGTLVLIASGNTNSNTFWQMTASSGVVDTNANNWTKVMTAGPPLVYTQGNGIGISNQVVTAVAASGGGLQVTSGGIGLDTTVAVRKFVGTVPSGSTICTITHNLNTTSVQVSLIDVASGDIRLIGATITGLNTVSLEFANAPATNQFRVMVTG